MDLRKKRTVQELDHGIKIYQNFCRDIDFQRFTDAMDELPWTPDIIYNSDPIPDMDDLSDQPFKDFQLDAKYNTQMVHCLFHAERLIFPKTSQEIEMFNFILSSMKDLFDIYAWVRLKSNITFFTDKIVEHGFHVDRMPITSLSKHQTTAILHLDDSDGYTKFFKDNITIPSKSNQLITFPSDLYHTGTSCTNQNNRRVLNMNFFGTPEK